MSNDHERHPVVLFDGVCNLCNATVQFIIRHDKAERFRFASLQGRFGQEVLAAHQLPPNELDTFLLLDGGKLFARSTGALALCRRLGGWWQLLYVFMLIPAPLRDLVYGFVARNRYRWFGKRETCYLPSPALRKRFLD
jgi:predicted DCC family thiol-disulfide oxidoreductase YuxK